MPSCQMCNLRPAKIHYTEIVNSDMVALDLCLECAEEKGIDVKKPNVPGLGDLVAGLIDKSADTESEKITRVKCPGCGYAYSDFKKVGRFGCPECYEAFASQLTPLLRHVHGSTQHTGKVPETHEAAQELHRKLLRLRRELDDAVRVEDYEHAAEIRDEIKELESTVEEGKKSV